MSERKKSGFSFDFNEAGPSFMYLGGAIGAAVEGAAADLEQNPNAFASEVATLRVARLMLVRAVGDPRANNRAKAALRMVHRSLRRIETKLRRDANRKSTGRPTKPMSTLERDARLVFAIRWLQELNVGRLSREQALNTVARATASAATLQRANRRLERLVNDFGRKTDPDYARHREAMRNVRFEVWAEFFRTWKEAVEMPDGSISYPGEFVESDHHDATREQVIAWVKQKRV